MANKSHSHAEEEERVVVAVNVGESLYRRLKNQLVLRRAEGKKLCRHQWLSGLLRKRLEEENELVRKSLNRDRWVTLRLEAKLARAIDDHVAFLKRLHQSYSRRRWLREALEEGITQEEEHARQLLEQFLPSFPDQSS